MTRDGIDRREFLGKAALGICSTGLGVSLLTAGATGESQTSKIIYRTLGRTKLRIPIVSFGVMNSDSPDLIKKALEIGILHYDTAHGYLRGNSEKALGRVLEETGQRKNVYVATKMRFERDREKNVFVTEGTERAPGATPENLDSQLQTSLQRLRSDYVDVLYLHSCYSPQMATYEPLMKALVRAKEAGKARFIGVSTHRNEPAVIRAAVDAGVYDVVQTSYNYLKEHKEEVKKAIAYAAGKDVGVIAMKTQGGGRLNKEKPGEVNHKAALRWVLNDENVCTSIPGITTFDQMDTDFSVMSDLTLSEEEKRDLELASMLRGPFYCQNCRACIPTCPGRVEIPNLMRAYMYAEAYGNMIQAEMTATELPVGRGLDVCRSCLSCAASCRRGIEIHERVRALADQLPSGHPPIGARAA
jgi:predicted aldo/keto reductase-like oxidoreductase